MLKYTLKRILTGILSLFVLVSVAFFLTRLMPGSPFETGNTSAHVQAEIEAEYGLSKPLFQQYQLYLSNLLHGDLGISYKKPGVSVVEVIARAFPATGKLGLLAVCVSLLVGTALGIWQATTGNKTVRTGIWLGTILGSGIPNFVWAIILLLLFGVKLKVLPVTGLDSWQSYLLPVFTLALYPTSVITRMTRNSSLREMQKDYVILAKVKGLSKKRIVYVHILKNAWLPVLNYAGPAAAFLLTGSFVVESVFTIPGLGREFVSSIANRDYTLILGLTVFMGAVVIGVNLLVDLLCAYLNPKVRIGLAGGE